MLAIKKMKMMQLVAPLSQLTDVIVSMFQTGGIHLVDAEKMIEHYAFSIPVTEKNMAKTVDVSTVRYFEKENRTGYRRNAVLGYLQAHERDMGNIFDRASLTTQPTPEQEAVLAGLMSLDEEMERQRAEQRQCEMNLQIMKILTANDIEHEDLRNLENFKVEYGTLNEMGRHAIRGGYQRIPAAILHLGQQGGEELYLMIYPNKVENEIRRLEESLNWKRLEPTFPEQATNAESIRSIEEVMEKREKDLARMEWEKQERISRHRKDLEGYYYAIALDDAVSKAKTYLARGRDYFYLAGWVSASDEKAFRRTAESFDDTLVQFLDKEDVSGTAPTRLSNNRLVRPFEAMVKMYGTPNYAELDPTGFFALTYVVLFGAMFGDLGQGAVFALLGILLQKKRHPNLGGVVLRMGLSSMIFGLAYGSVFGLEHVIPALLIRPFENINVVLISAIAFGILLSSVAYVFGIINKLRMGEYQEAWFGKEGVAGFVLYLSMILLVVNMAVMPVFPDTMLIALILLCLVGLLFQKPLTNLIRGKRPLLGNHAGDYYVETGFSLLETVISIFSGALSFIRVGAFAINHVGLFMAFSTMGAMIGGAGNIVMLILGNIVIIGLEGLIVFIQSLRLEYYELFGKYYVGNGVPFMDTKQSLTNR